jgi:hypothetical protein
VISVSPRRQAREARRQTEDALDQLGTPWPWRAGLSKLLDLWIFVEESTAR